MERIKLHDKEFKVIIPYSEIQENIKKVAAQINSDYKNCDTPLFLSVLNGSFMFSADLLKNIEFNCEISFIKLSSYAGTGSTGKVTEMIGVGTSLKGRNIIIIEDIVDTGGTVEVLFDLINKEGAKSVKICTLLLKPEAYKKDIPIDYAAIRIPNDFIVGYGLDYDELGRNYKDIYVLDPK